MVFLPRIRAAVILAVLSSPALSLPLFGWKTVPVFAYVANETGPFNDAAAKALASYRVVTVGKGQGIYDPTDNRDAEAKMHDAGKLVKSVDANVSMLAAFDALLSWPVYHFSTVLTHHPLWWLRNDTGFVIRLKGPSAFPQPEGGMVLPDFTNASAAAAFASSCFNLTWDGAIDGCFVDNMANITTWGKMALGPSKAGAWLDARADTARTLQGMVDKAPVVLNNMQLPNVTATLLSNYNASLFYIRQHQQLARAGYMVQVRAGTARDSTDNFCRNITNSLSAFLIAAEKQSYYACATNFTVNANWPSVQDQWLDLRPEYARPLGLPNGAATIANKVFTRHFASNTTVMFNITSKQGLIQWSTGETQGDLSILDGLRRLSAHEQETPMLIDDFLALVSDDE